MMRPCVSISLSFVFVILALSCHANGNKYKRICYYTNWSQYRQGVGKYMPEDIDPKLCSHIMYAFAKVENSELKTVEWNDKAMFQKFQNIKRANPGLKTLIAVGGWNARSTEFSNMVDTPSNRRKFIASAMMFLQEYGFDGMDLDWEYPTLRGGKPTDRDNLAHLIKELRMAFNPHNYLLTAAVPAGKTNIDAGYDVPAMGRYLDFINLMSYDIHGSWERNTGENSPLYAGRFDNGANKQLNMKWAAEYWVKKGIPKQKLIIGMATYGRSFRLANSANNGVGAPATGPGQAGQFTREAGFLSYYEICKMVESGKGTVRWVEEQKVPYYFKGKLWVGYDNVQSITTKVRWLMKEGYGGAMVWSLDLDDFRKVCTTSTRRYPLLSTIHDLLEGGTLPPTPKPRPTPKPKPTTIAVKTTEHTTQYNPHTEFSCVNKPDGFYADPLSCISFYRCISQKAFKYYCPSGLEYNSIAHVCDWPQNVDCKITVE